MTDKPSDEDIVQLARQAGLVLPTEYVPELVEAYGHVHRTIARISRPWSYGDEPAHVFMPNAFSPRKEQP